jgi:hypothetical protein
MPPPYGVLTCMYGLSGIRKAPRNPTWKAPDNRPPGPTPNNPDNPYIFTHRHTCARGEHLDLVAHNTAASTPL